MAVTLSIPLNTFLFLASDAQRSRAGASWIVKNFYMYFICLGVKFRLSLCSGDSLSIHVHPVDRIQHLHMTPRAILSKSLDVHVHSLPVFSPLKFKSQDSPNRNIEFLLLQVCTKRISSLPRTWCTGPRSSTAPSELGPKNRSGHVEMCFVCRSSVEAAVTSNDSCVCVPGDRPSWNMKTSFRRT